MDLQQVHALSRWGENVGGSCLYYVIASRPDPFRRYKRKTPLQADGTCLRESGRTSERRRGQETTIHRAQDCGVKERVRRNLDQSLRTPEVLDRHDQRPGPHLERVRVEGGALHDPARLARVHDAGEDRRALVREASIGVDPAEVVNLLDLEVRHTEFFGELGLVPRHHLLDPGFIDPGKAADRVEGVCTHGEREAGQHDEVRDALVPLDQHDSLGPAVRAMTPADVLVGEHLGGIVDPLDLELGEDAEDRAALGHEHLEKTAKAHAPALARPLGQMPQIADAVLVGSTLTDLGRRGRQREHRLFHLIVGCLPPGLRFELRADLLDPEQAGHEPFVTCRWSECGIGHESLDSVEG